MKINLLYTFTTFSLEKIEKSLETSQAFFKFIFWFFFIQREILNIQQSIILKI